MAAELGVNDTFDLTAPTGGHVQEASRETTAEIVTLKNNMGVTVKAVAKKMKTVNVMIKGKGDPQLAAVTAGDITEGTLKIISAKGDESAEDFPGFEIQAISYHNPGA